MTAQTDAATILDMTSGGRAVPAVVRTLRGAGWPDDRIVHAMEFVGVSDADIFRAFAPSEGAEGAAIALCRAYWPESRIARAAWDASGNDATTAESVQAVTLSVGRTVRVLSAVGWDDARIIRALVELHWSGAMIAHSLFRAGRQDADVVRALADAGVPDARIRADLMWVYSWARPGMMHPGYADDARAASAMTDAGWPDARVYLALTEDAPPEDEDDAPSDADRGHDASVACWILSDAGWSDARIVRAMRDAGVPHVHAVPALRDAGWDDDRIDAAIGR